VIGENKVRENVAHSDAPDLEGWRCGSGKRKKRGVRSIRGKAVMSNAPTIEFLSESL